MKILLLFFFNVSFTMLPEEEFKLLYNRLEQILPLSNDEKVKQINTQFLDNPLQITLIQNDKEYAIINEIQNRDQDFLQINFVQQDPDLTIFKAMSRISTDSKFNNINEIAKFIKEDLEYVIKNHQKEQEEYDDKIKFVIEKIESQLGSNKSKCQHEIEKENQKSIYFCEDESGAILLLINFVKIENHIMIDAQFEQNSNQVFFTINNENKVIESQLQQILANIEIIEFTQEDVLLQIFNKLKDNMAKQTDDIKCEETISDEKCNDKNIDGKICVYSLQECTNGQEDSRKLIKRKLTLNKNNQQPSIKIRKQYQQGNIILSQKINFYENQNRKLSGSDDIQLLQQFKLDVTQYDFENAPYYHIKYNYNDTITAEYSIPYIHKQTFDKNIDKIITDFQQYVLTDKKKEQLYKEKKGDEATSELIDADQILDIFNNFFQKKEIDSQYLDTKCELEEKENDVEDQVDEDQMDDQDDVRNFSCLDINGDRVVTGLFDDRQIIFLLYIKKQIDNKQQTMTETYDLKIGQKFDIEDVLEQAYINSDKKILLMI